MNLRQTPLGFRVHSERKERRREYGQNKKEVRMEGRKMNVTGFPTELISCKSICSFQSSSHGVMEEKIKS